MPEALLIGGSFAVFAVAVARLRRVDWLRAGASGLGYGLLMGILWIVGPGRDATETPDAITLVLFAALSGGLIAWASYTRSAASHGREREG